MHLTSSSHPQRQYAGVRLCLHLRVDETHLKVHSRQTCEEHRRCEEHSESDEAREGE